jgi:hypothetical protein
MAPLPFGSLATDEIGRLSASIEPAVGDVRWRWVLNDDSRLHSSELSREPHVSRSVPGALEATVTATTPDGVVLGTATTGVAVVASPVVNSAFTVRLDLPPEMRGGEDVTVRAVVLGGRAPYRYFWSGTHAATGSEAVVQAAAGPFVPVFVRVIDAAGRAGGAQAAVRRKAAALQVSVAAESEEDRDEEGGLRLRPDKRIAVRARVQDGTPPYRFTWSGASISGEGERVQLGAGSAREGRVGVQVVDAAGEYGTGEAAWTVVEAPLLGR